MWVIEMFPSINKKYLIESSIESKFERNHLNTNCSVYDGRIADSFVEFHMPGSENELVDLSS